MSSAPPSAGCRDDLIAGSASPGTAGQSAPRSAILPSVPNTERSSDNRTRRPAAPRGRARRASTDGGHRAANRVVDILELLAASRDGLALREVSARLRAPKSSLLPL